MKEAENLYPMYKNRQKLPEKPAGYIPVKFHGEFTFIPERRNEDPMRGKSNFSEGQIIFLGRLEKRRTLYNQEFNVPTPVLAWEED